MEWTKLDIRKASVLKKQVDLALLTLKQSMLEGDGSRRQTLIQSFVTEVDIIEEFRANNDSDERSILFERERLRLRKAVQEAVAANPIGNLSNSNTTGRPATPPDSNKSVLQFGSQKANTSSGNRSPKAVKRDAPLSPDRPRGAAYNTSLSAPTAQRIGMSISSPTKKVYDWELGGGVKDRGELCVDDFTFFPASQSGIYIRDEAIIAGQSAEVKASYEADGSKQDCLFLLTADEINVLASRLQHRKHTDKSSFKNAGSTSGVQHSTPYVEPSRITKGLLRPDQPKKWIDKTSIRPNAK